MNELKWLDGYSGQTTDALISLEGEYRIDSLILAFEQGLYKKAERLGIEVLSENEIVILAIEALEREVNNGGFSQFFSNSSNFYAPMIVDALKNIGCAGTAELTQRAISILRIDGLITDESIDLIMQEENEERDKMLDECDSLYYETAGDLSIPLFEFIKKNRDSIYLKC